jgi:hypothetical protein
LISVYVAGGSKRFKSRLLLENEVISEVSSMKDPGLVGGAVAFEEADDPADP